MRKSRATAFVIAAFLVLVTSFPLSAGPTESSGPADVDPTASGEQPKLKRMDQEVAEFDKRASKGTETGLAACYDRRPNSLTAAHATIPIGTRVKVTNLENGKSVMVLVDNHMSSGRIIMNISKRACKELRFGRTGEAKVKLEIEATPFGPPFDTQTAVRCQAATCPMFTQIYLGDAKLRAAIDRLLIEAELKKDADWFPESVVDSAIIPIRYQGNDYIRAAVCEAHNCVNSIDILYRPDDGRLTMLYTTEADFKGKDWFEIKDEYRVGFRSRFLGGPTEFEQVLLQHFRIDQAQYEAQSSKVYPVEVELLSSLAPDSVLSSKSQNSNTPTTVNFVNSSGNPVDVCWVNYNGERVLYKHLGPEESFVAQTYVTHPWVVYDDRISAFIAGFLPVNSTAEAIIGPPSGQSATGKPNALVRSASGCQAAER